MGFVGNLVLFAAVKEFANPLRIDKVIAMVRVAPLLVAPFFDSRCRSSGTVHVSAKERFISTAIWRISMNECPLTTFRMSQ